MEPFPGIPGYEIEKKLGQGRVTDDYLATIEGIPQKVVIKVLKPDLVQAEAETFPVHFLYECRKATQLDHSNIAQILEVGETPNHYFFVMEYFQESLREKITNKSLGTKFEMEISGTPVQPLESTGSGEIDAHEVLDILRQLLDALDYTHLQEVFHRDIRPDNIFFREDGTPVIVDIHIAQVVEAAESLKEKGVPAIPPQYASPEQILNEPADASSDIYSLGVTLYELLTGQAPYDDGGAAIPQLSGQFSLFQPLIDRMMAREKEERAQSSAELILLIEELSDQLTGDSQEEPMEEAPEAEEETGEELHVELDLGEALRKEIEVEKHEEIQPDEEGPSKRKPMLLTTESRLPMKTGKIGEILEKLRNPKILIPAAAAIVLAAVLVIFILPSGTPDTTGTQKSAEPGQKQEAPVLSPEEQQQRETLYKRKFQLAQRDFKAGRYKKALQQLSEAEKIKSSGELETLKQQILAKMTKKDDDKAYKHASRTNTIASYQEYLNKYASGLHAEEAQKKIAELKELKKREEERKRKLAASRVKLRSTPQTLTRDDVKVMLKKYGFFEKYYNSTGDFRSKYEVQTIKDHKVIIDYSTGLMWHQSGSEEYMKHNQVRQWIQELNRQKYAGYSGWRLPTLEEAASLMNRTENRYALHVDLLFSREQRYIWTADKYDKNRVWVVDFYGGDFNPVASDETSFVRPVRSEK